MTKLLLSASTLVTALGAGRQATLQALREERCGLEPCAFAEVTGGHVGRVHGLEEAGLGEAGAGEAGAGEAGLGDRFAHFDCRNNRLAALALRQDGFEAAVRAAAARHGAGRVAVVCGTSTSGILSAENAYRARDPASGLLPAWFRYDGSYDLFSLSRYVAERLGLEGPAMTVSTACASSARAVLDAAQLIEAGVADAAVVGGADSLCRLTLRGFASLELVSPERCRPFDRDRRGLSVGEAAGFALLERPDDVPEAANGGIVLSGAGASSDGFHMSSPRPDGEGAVLAMRAALARAGLAAEEIDHINLHGTGTRANDLMEGHAVRALFGDRPVACASSKGLTGHCMGSSGIVEALIAALCLEEGLLPRSFGLVDPDPEIPIRPLTETRSAHLRHVMSNSFGFGGVNVSLVLSRAQA